jgi:hypothetical protein
VQVHTHMPTCCTHACARAPLFAGVVPPGEVAVFNWLFQPLEARAYSVALPLSLGPGAAHGGAHSAAEPLLLHGRGYHPTQHPQAAAPTVAEASQCVACLACADLAQRAPALL